MKKVKEHSRTSQSGGTHKQWVCDERGQKKFVEVEGICIYSTTRLGLERSLEKKIWKENGGRSNSIYVFILKANVDGWAGEL